MAITNFIPEIWDAELSLQFRQAAVAANLVDRHYEGELRKGNTVHITSAAAVAVKDYKAANRTTSPDTVSTTQIDLLIDQEKSFDFQVDDIDRAQAAGSLEAFTTSAGQGLAEDADKFILNLAAAAATPVADLTGAATSDGIFNVVRDLRKSLNKNLVPLGNRVLIVNAEFEALLLAADAKLTDAAVSGTPAGLREATLGRLLGFDVVTTENLPGDPDTAQAVAFWRPAVSYVSQIDELEAMRAQNSFADRLRGLHVYGGKVTRPEAVVSYTDNPAA